MVKKFLNKGNSASKRTRDILKNSATKLNESKYDKILKKEASKQLSDKIIPAVVGLAGSKIADKITSLKVSEKEKPQEIESEQQEIIIPPHQRQDIIDDLRLF